MTFSRKTHLIQDGAVRHPQANERVERHPNERQRRYNQAPHQLKQLAARPAQDTEKRREHKEQISSDQDPYHHQFDILSTEIKEIVNDCSHLKSRRFITRRATK